MFEKLKDIALRIYIDPIKTVDHATKVETVIKVLSEISQSYNNYLEIEFFKNDVYRKAYENNNKILDTLKKELSLLIVDLNYSSFEAALAPDITELESPIFKNEVLEWKRDTFDLYKELVFSEDFENSTYLNKVANRYNEVERGKIFKPLFSSLGDGNEYTVNIKDNNHNIVKKLIHPEKSKDFYIPILPIVKPEKKTYSTIQIFAKIAKKPGDDTSFTKKDLKEILYTEILEHDTYPFKPNVIRYQQKIFVLNENLDCSVGFEEDNYIIKNEELDLIVWGSTRKEVEDAFNFSFSSLYTNYCLEDDSKLSDEALLLKNKLTKIIKSVIDEE